MEWKLDQQMCFLLYANSRNIIKMYKSLLDPYHLTYTQYITMIALWEKDHQTVSDLGQRLSLDSGTLTPLLKKLEKENYVKRVRDVEDERKVIVELTSKGKLLSEEAKKIPFELIKCVNLPEDELYQLFHLLTKLHQSNQVCETIGESNE